MFKDKEAAKKYYREYARKWRAANPEADKQACAKHYVNHREKRKAASKRYYNSNKEKAKASQKRYEETHSEQRRASNAMRRANKANATPLWLDSAHREDLKQIYIFCPENKEVDHIIPVQGKDVCGLHVPWNLQYLTEAENCSKRNKFDGTYDNEGWRKCA